MRCHICGRLFFLGMALQGLPATSLGGPSGPGITGGGIHSLAVKTDGTIWTWGGGGDGELGNGATTNCLRPAQISSLSGAVDIAGGASHSLAVKSDGTVWAWGYNSSGQLGNGAITNCRSPVQCLGLAGVIAVSGGGQHSLALRSDGSVWTWGYNDHGQLGDGTTNNRPIAVQVSGLSACVATGAGEVNSLALKSDGTVWTWGYGYTLGNGTTTNSKTPVQVSGLSGVVAVASGYNHCLALKSDGTVWAWGPNFTGEVGDGTTTQRLTPVQVSSLSGVVAIHAGTQTSFGLKSDGTVWAWGRSNFGQLGNGGTTNCLSPVQVAGPLSGVVAVDGGLNHTFAVKTNGTVWAWGLNATGQLGVGDTANRITPVQVTSLSNVWSSGLLIRPDTVPVSSQPAYDDVPAPPPEKDKLVVITHGWWAPWNWGESNPVGWVDTMSTSILQFLGANSSWQVIGWKWIGTNQGEKSKTWNPRNALNHAIQEGEALGRLINTHAYSEVHFIGHSAGSGLIETAAEVVKTEHPEVIIQTTFLDPFTPPGFTEIYGQVGNWSDNYFARDIAPSTQEKLSYAHNVDVTWLDPNYVGSLSCASSHGWPHDFYYNTTTGSVSQAQGYGFLLSREGGNWNPAAYPSGNEPVVLGTNPCAQSSIALTTPSVSTYPLVHFPATTYQFSQGGSVQINDTQLYFVQINPQPSSVQRSAVTAAASLDPVWLAALIPASNFVNQVTFQLQFTSAVGAQGLLSVYWDGTLLGSFDERNVLIGMQEFSMELPSTYSGGSYTLAFRLDSYTNVPSSVVIDHVATGFVNYNPALAANFTGSPTNGVVPLSVKFVDSSAGTITNRFWDFGDGQITNTLYSTRMTHTYSTGGTYTVKLIIRGTSGIRTNTQANLITALADSDSDGIPDSWTQQYFGHPTGQAGDRSRASDDADGTGQNNLFKYVAGLNPTNPASVFLMNVTPVTGQPTQRVLTYNPVVSGRIYTPESRTNLTFGSWAALTGYSGPTTNGNQVTVTDLNAVEPQKFYHIKITLQ